MLVLSRERDESIMIGGDVEITVVDIRGDKVRLGITAPKAVGVHRKEVYEAIRRENRQSPAATVPKRSSGLNLEELNRVNHCRAKRWHPGGLNEWSVNDWLAAFGGEAGEALNAGKKHRRIISGLQQHGNVPDSLDDAAEKIMDELADAVIYADLVATRLGKSLSQAIVRKFNAISEREGFPDRIGSAVIGE